MGPARACVVLCDGPLRSPRIGGERKEKKKKEAQSRWIGPVAEELRPSAVARCVRGEMIGPGQTPARPCVVEDYWPVF